MANGLQERQQVQVFICCFSRQSAGKGSAVSCEIQILCNQVRREACFAIFTDTLSFLMIHGFIECSIFTWYEIRVTLLTSKTSSTVPENTQNKRFLFLYFFFFFFFGFVHMYSYGRNQTKIKRLPLVWKLHFFNRKHNILEGTWSILLHPHIPTPAPRFII